MPRTALLTLLLCLASPAGMPRATAAQLNYTLYVLGVPLADAVMNVDMTPSGYGITLHYHHTGLLGLVARNHLDMRVRGVFENGRPAPLEFGANSRFRGQDRTIGVAWRAGIPVVTAINPPVETERETVPATQRARTIDPISSIVLLLRAAQTGRCEGTSQSYDGRRLRLFEARTTGEEDVPPSSRSIFSGRGLRCEFTEHTLAGFRLGPDRDDDARPRAGTIWLARLSPDYVPVPVRISVETRWLGDAVIYLTAASP